LLFTEQPNKGALNIDAQAQDGEFLVEAISFYSDAKLASDLTVEADWARRGLYVGPQFETLDEKVQEQFYTYLEERGISTELALFIPELAEWKEQREYCKWLENVKAFVDA
jgi:complement component 1 Q subcomponent-binding protein, mitochondrial